MSEFEREILRANLNVVLLKILDQSSNISLYEMLKVVDRKFPHLLIASSSVHGRLKEMALTGYVSKNGNKRYNITRKGKARLSRYITFLRLLMLTLREDNEN